MPLNFLPGVRATKEQRRVITNYLTNGGNKTAAFLAVFEDRAANWSQKRRRDEAIRYFSRSTMKSLMQEAEIETRLKLEKEAMAGVENAITKYAITKDRIMEELAKIAFAQQTDVMSWGPGGVVVKDSSELGDASAAVGEVSGGGDVPIKVKMLDKQQALINLGRELGMFSQKVDVKGQVAVAAKFVIER